MSDYAFASVWEVEAPIDRVWDVINTPERYPEWFPYVKEAETVAPGDGTGTGTVTRLRWTTALPYGFVFETHSTRTDPPHVLEIVAAGDIEGTGLWELSEDAGITRAEYFWTVHLTKQWMNLLAPVARPIFGWNHAVMMKGGGEGLAKDLGSRLVLNHSYTAQPTNPLVPVSATAGLLSLILMIGRALRPS